MNELSKTYNLGNYKLEYLLGRGGCAPVFAAKSVKNENSVIALKVHTDILDREYNMITHSYPVEYLQFFTGSFSCSIIPSEHIPDILQQEFNFLKQLDGSLFPGVQYFFSNKEITYYAMDLLKGQSFREIMKQNRNNPPLLLGYIYQLLTSLNEYNTKYPEFYHGDLKPENIIIENNNVRLIDPSIRYPNNNFVNRTITVPYNPLGEFHVKSDTCAITIMLIESLLGYNPFGSIKKPLIKRYGKGIRRQDKYLIEQLSPLKKIRKDLPKPVRRILIDWLLHPRDYDEMIQEWKLFEKRITGN